jgi:DNA-binding transcriptional ArsR family regulator
MSLEDSEAVQAPSAAAQLRTITDARTLRALAHPVRIALIETLSVGGPMTATQAGESIDESPTTCSFHLRQLAKYGLVEEAGGGKGRSRPWRMTSIGLSISVDHDDPEAQIATRALLRLTRERYLDRLRTWMEASPTYPREWQDAAGHNEHVFFMTAEELKQLNDELTELLLPRFRERLTDPSKRPAGSVPVEMLLFSYPLRLPVDGGQPAGPDAE